MSEIYSSLYTLFHGSGLLAYAALFAWGILGMTLSPCSVATIPLVVGYIGNSDAPDFRTSFKISLAFSAGVFVNLAFLGGLLTSAGLFLGGIDRYTNYIVAVVFLVFGLHLLGAVSIPWFRGGSAPGTKYTGLKGALVLGVVSGLALGPCSFAYSAPVIMLAISVASTDMLRALLLVAAYGAGLSSVIIAAGSASDLFSRFVFKGGRGTAWLERISGLLLIAAAVYLALSSPSLY
ncbi:MAG: cytochrome C biogenesis protein [Synergistaceae bacterium]|nr:cytochrome c biogenesis protein CcdA [Synergistota bacterium]NLM71170.1 cytochrome C biogenesis protein [Synergistaceae bacterium]